MQAQPKLGRNDPAQGRQRQARRLPAVMGGIAVAALASAGVLLALNRPEASALALRMPDDGTTGMCAPFSVDLLAAMSPAFAGTATHVTDDRVVLDVDRWYTGGDAAQVVLDVPAGILLGGAIDFREGERYLITAADGTVNLCGFSGEATPELTAAFEQAF